MQTHLVDSSSSEGSALPASQPPGSSPVHATAVAHEEGWEHLYNRPPGLGVMSGLSKLVGGVPALVEPPKSACRGRSACLEILTFCTTRMVSLNTRIIHAEYGV